MNKVVNFDLTLLYKEDFKDYFELKKNTCTVNPKCLETKTALCYD